jgi:putative IMPACT (imprinted ancient) family translation regulator
MVTSSLSELKKELSLLPPNEIVEICMKIVRYKKENKELLHYLLFHAHDEQSYIEEVKKEITVRKILKITNNYIRYSKLKQTEVELRLHLCAEIKNTGVLRHADKSLTNLYQRQIEKIYKAMEKLHEDLQHDYLEELKSLV